uniref:Tnp_DDE_dom domain-containing protein n=1 Tax=Elaeophora elaphi TaxID=1147741 RepID=A0A0R3RRB2_9BILA
APINGGFETKASRLKLDFPYLIRLERIKKKTEILGTLQFKQLQDPNGNRNKIPGMPELKRESKRQRTRPLNTYLLRKEKIRRICGSCQEEFHEKAAGIDSENTK